VALAFLPGTFLARNIQQVGLPAMTPYTVTDPRRLRTLLEQVRTRGWATMFPQMCVGARGAAVPIFGHQRKVLGSLGIFGPHPRFSDRKARSVMPHLLSHAAAITKALRGLSNEQAPGNLRSNPGTSRSARHWLACGPAPF